MTVTQQQDRTRMTVYVNRELAAQLHYLAVKNDCHVSELVEEILTKELVKKVQKVIEG